MAQVIDTTDPDNPKVLWEGDNPREDWEDYGLWAADYHPPFKNVVVVYEEFPVELTDKKAS